jgi:hypothetical protein
VESGTKAQSTQTNLAHEFKASERRAIGSIWALK